jgi:hypothetical protein
MTLVKEFGLWHFLSFGALCWAITEVVSIICRNRRQATQAEQLAVLKKSMIDRGMSAEEIERVVRAGGPTEDSKAAKAAKPEKGPVLAMIEQGMEAVDIEKVIVGGLKTGETPDDLVKAMSEHGYSGDDIARVLAALDRRPRVPVI